MYKASPASKVEEAAMFDQEEPRPRPKRLAVPAFDSWGVAELNLYIDELRAETDRAEAEIARKQGHRNAAAAFFKTG